MAHQRHLLSARDAGSLVLQATGQIPDRALHLQGTIRRVPRNERRDRQASIVLRWAATGMMEANAGFRRVKAYSPDLNQIEQVFAKVKTLGADGSGMHHQCIPRSIAALVAESSQSECESYPTNAGYASS